MAVAEPTIEDWRTTIAYVYDDAPTIALFSETECDVRGLMGPFGSGKSAGCVMQILKEAAKQKPQGDGIKRSRFAVIRNTYPQLKDTTIKTFFEWVPPKYLGKYNKTDHDYFITGLDGMEIEILFRALDRPEHVQNLLSLELTGAWINEAREVPWAIIEAIQGRIGRYPSMINGGPVAPCLIMDTNPPDDDSWWYKKFETELPDGWQLFKQPSGLHEWAENKTNLTPRYYEKMSGMDPESHRVYVEGEYGMLRDGKPVYPDYNDTLHLVEYEPNAMYHTYIGWDFGLTPAAVLTQVTPDGRWIAFDEVIGTDIYFPTFMEEFVNYVGEKYPWMNVTDRDRDNVRLERVTHIGDPSGNSRSAIAKDDDAATCMQIARGYNITIDDGIQTPLTRIGAVAYVLTKITRGRVQFGVTRQCRVLRRGFMGRYKYKRVVTTGTDIRHHDAPDKNEFSHPHDGLQYVAAKLFGHLIKNIKSYKENRNKPMDIPLLGIK